MITPNQHFSMAHPNNQTIYIDRDFQYICLLAKASKIMANLTSSSEPDFYNFNDYRFVLNTGLETDEFDSVSDLDFASIIDRIDIHYSDCSRYNYLVINNKPIC